MCMTLVHSGNIENSSNLMANLFLQSGCIVILLPKAIAVCKCQAPTNSFDSVSIVNARADAAAHSAAKEGATHRLSYMLTDTDAPSSLIAMQQVSTEDRQIWKKNGCTLKNNVWFGPNDKPCLPKHFYPHFAKLIHGLDHV